MTTMFSTSAPAGVESLADRCARQILDIVDTRGGAMSRPQRDQLVAMKRLLSPANRARAAARIPEIAEDAEA